MIDIRNDCIKKKLFGSMESNYELKYVDLRIFNIDNQMSYSNEILISTLLIDIHKLYDIISERIYEYMEIMGDIEPTTVIIGNKLQSAIIKGKLPEQRLGINNYGMPKIIYIPNAQDIIVL